jgi:hypothetical protein
MRYELYKDMVLTRDLPGERLKCGDIVYPNSKVEERACVGDQAQQSFEDEICCVRPLVSV